MAEGIKVVYERVNDDWARLWLAGKVFREGHCIYPKDWLDLCYELGAQAEQREVKELFPSV